jgi:hypothetical protein
MSKPIPSGTTYDRVWKVLRNGKPVSTSQIMRRAKVCAVNSVVHTLRTKFQKPILPASRRCSNGVVSYWYQVDV